jgi:O-6-methylguanine DNA methyltransferase
MQITTFTSTEFKKYIKQATTVYSQLQTNAGILYILATDTGIYHASFEQPAEYKQYSFVQNIDTTKIILVGTEFQIKVWQALSQISQNKTCSYQELAHTISHPRAWRAVANAVANNNLAFFIPCHRIIRKNGELGGYRWGIEKKKLLTLNNSHQSNR